MCKCNPNVRTPFCGAVGCEWPEKEVNYLEEAGETLKEYVEPNSMVDEGNLFFAATTYKEAYEKLKTELSNLYASALKQTIDTNKEHAMCICGHISHYTKSEYEPSMANLFCGNCARSTTMDLEELLNE